MNPWMLIAAAASVVLLLGWYFLFRTTLQTFHTGAGEQLTIELPDRSKVRLNAASTLSFDADAWPEMRRVDLAGEAFFEVARGAVFSVYTAPGSVAVAGTSFNVFARENLMEVLCYSGQVEVSNEEGKDTLRAGQKAVVRKAAPTDISTFEATESPGWVRGWVEFKPGAPLSRVFDELERQYGKQVQFQGEPARIYSGGFPTDDLPAALKFICDPMGLTYEVQGEEIIIK